MAATLNIEPQDMVLAKNPIRFQWTGGSYIQATGLQALLQVYITAGIAAGQTLDLEWPANGGTNLVLTADASPDDSGNQFSSYVSGTLPDYTQALVLELQQNSDLYSDYLISYAGLVGPGSEPGINIQARTKGTDYSLTVNGLPTGMSQNFNQAGVDQAFSEKYSLRVSVETETALNSNVWNELISSEISPDSAAVIEFDASRIINSLMSAFLPSASLATIQSVTTGIIRRFRLRFAEKYGDPQAVKRVDTAGPYYAVMGALSPEKFTQDSFYSDLVQIDKMWLTWTPEPKPTAQSTPQYLFYILGSGSVTSIELNVNITFADGTTATSALLTKGSTAINEMFCIPAGHDQLGIDALGSSDVMEYELWLKDQAGNDISPKYKFEMDRDQRISENVFGFINSFGAFESLRCVGEKSTTMKVAGQLSEKVLAADYSISDGEFGQFDKYGQYYFEIGMGILDRDQVKAMKDFFLSEFTYYLDGSDWVPVVVESKSISLDSDLVDLTPFSFKYSIAYNAKGHSA